MDIQETEYFVYILKSLKDGKHYIGFTTNIEKRLKEHNSGKTKSNKHRIPFDLIYTEKCQTIKDAKAREKQIKSYKGGTAFKELVLRFAPHPAGLVPPIACGTIVPPTAGNPAPSTIPQCDTIPLLRNLKT